MKYQAAVLFEANKIRIEEREVRSLKPPEALVKVSYAGVCGTDLAIYSGAYQVPLPIVLGHEFSGRVEDVGAKDHQQLIGQRVTAEINSTCRSYNLAEPCAACRRGLDHHCLQRTVLGIMNYDGAFAQYVIVPAGNLRILPGAISDKEAVFIEPLAAAIQTFELSPIDFGQLVVILGAGRLGLLTGLVARTYGARVISMDVIEDKLNTARQLGLETAEIKNTEAAIENIKNVSHGLGADMVVECTGRREGLKLALKLIRPRGTVALKSTPGRPVKDLDTTFVVVNELRLQGSRCGPFDKAIKMITEKHFELGRLIDQVFSLSQVEEALKQAVIATKVLIEC